MSDEHWIEFGAWLKEQRVASRWSRRKLAQAAGISDSSWANYERGGRYQDGKWWVQRPSAETLQGIAKALGLPEAEVFARAGATVPGGDTDDDRWINEQMKKAGVAPARPRAAALVGAPASMAAAASGPEGDRLLAEMDELRETVAELRDMVALVIARGQLDR
jgi:transcriptional regulator with XRE-family HTH domain